MTREQIEPIGNYDPERAAAREAPDTAKKFFDGNEDGYEIAIEDLTDGKHVTLLRPAYEGEDEAGRLVSLGYIPLEDFIKVFENAVAEQD